MRKLLLLGFVLLMGLALMSCSNNSIKGEYAWKSDEMMLMIVKSMPESEDSETIIVDEASDDILDALLQMDYSEMSTPDDYAAYDYAKTGYMIVCEFEDETYGVEVTDNYIVVTTVDEENEPTSHLFVISHEDGKALLEQIDAVYQ